MLAWVEERRGKAQLVLSRGQSIAGPRPLKSRCTEDNDRHQPAPGTVTAFLWPPGISAEPGWRLPWRQAVASQPGKAERLSEGALVLHEAVGNRVLNSLMPKFTFKIPDFNSPQCGLQHTLMRIQSHQSLPQHCGRWAHGPELPDFVGLLTLLLCAI